MTAINSMGSTPARNRTVGVSQLEGAERANLKGNLPVSADVVYAARQGARACVEKAAEKFGGNVQLLLSVDGR